MDNADLISHNVRISLHLLKHLQFSILGKAHLIWRASSPAMDHKKDIPTDSHRPTTSNTNYKR